MNTSNIKIFPSKLSGTLKAIPSKSQAHRALICAALANEDTVIECDGTSKDIEATKSCLAALKQSPCILNPGESGSTFRFLLPVVGALGLDAEFRLEGRLPERPLDSLYNELVRHGCKLSPQGSNPFTISGQLLPGTYVLDSGVSSQFVSGLLFALPLLGGDSVLQLQGEPESVPYIDLTMAMLERFGIDIEWKNNIFNIKGGQTYKSPKTVKIEGDWSNAAFWLCAGVQVTELDNESNQGDKAIVKLLKELPTAIDAADIPDLVPILSIAAAVANGVTTIYNAGRLRIKESDRIQSTYEMLRNLGVNVEKKPDGLTVHGGNRLKGGVISSYNDHRIAMSAAIASHFCNEPIIIKDAKAVEKSYPRFFDDFQMLGGKIEWLHNTEIE